jgi:signal transduction histidine kinase
MADFIFADALRLETGTSRSFFDEFHKELVHKLNNQIGIVQGFASLVMLDRNLSQDNKEHIQQILDCARVGTRLNQELLLASGASRCSQDPLAVSDLFQHWRTKAQELAASSGVHFQGNPNPASNRVTGDASKVGEIVDRLLRNAVEGAAAVGNGSIALDMFAPGDASPGNTVDLFIRNTSAPLEASQLVKLFDPFYSSKGSGHFGLGLTTSAVLAGQMNMRLGISYADRTTTLWLAMPAID